MHNVITTFTRVKLLSADVQAKDNRKGETCRRGSLASAETEADVGEAVADRLNFLLVCKIMMACSTGQSAEAKVCVQRSPSQKGSTP